MKQLATLAIILINLSVTAQSSDIKGTVTDKNDLPLPGISVYIKNTTMGNSTNASGNFIIEDVTPGKHILVLSAIGYLSIEKEIELLPGKEIKLDLTIEESVSRLNQVEVISKGKSGSKDIPGSVQYLSPKDLDKFSYTDINRTLRTVAGVNIQEEDGFGLRPNIGLRATGVERSSKITLMEDGILIAPAPYVAPAAYYFPTIGRMEGLEVMKGSSQIKYGPYTTGGALNLISTGIPDEFTGKVTMMFGNFGMNNVHVNAGNAHKNVAYVFESFQYGADGFKELDGGGNTGFKKQDYMGKIRINTSDEAKFYQSLTLKYGYTDENSNETYLGLTDEDFNKNPFRRYAGSQADNMKSTHQQLALTHLIKLSPKVTLTTSVYRNDFKRNWYKLDKVRDSSGSSVSISTVLDDPINNTRAFSLIKGNASLSDEALLVKANNRSYYAQGIQSTLSYRFTKAEIKHHLELGLRYHQDEVDRFQWVDEYSMKNDRMNLLLEGEAGSESNLIEHADALASYVQYEVKFEKLSVIPGLRYEHIDLAKQDFGKQDTERLGNDLKKSKNSVDVFLPGLGADYKLNVYNSLFVGFHKGFAPPGTHEGTKPEESNNYELGYRHFKKSLSFQAVFFFNDYKNLLGADLNASGGTGSNDLYNGGKAESKGLEIQAGYDLMSKSEFASLSLPIQLAYTYTDAHFQSSFDSEFEGWGSVKEGDELPYLAKHQVSLLIGVEYKRLSFNTSIRYMSEMRTQPGQGHIPDNQKTDAYLVTDLGLNYKIQREINLFANLTNLSDEVYVVARRPAGLRPGMPRSFNLGLKVSF